MAAVVTILEKLDVLPFREVLSWERFQLFCTDVLYKRNNSVDSREYLSKGSPQQGIDIYVVPRGLEKLTVTQCKLEKNLGPQDIINIVDEFLKGSFVAETVEFILCTNVDLNTTKDEQAIANVRKKLALCDIELNVWDSKGLSKELRTNPVQELVEIVYHYFDEEVCRAFFGDRWEPDIRRLRPVKKILYQASADYIERNITSYEDRLTKPGKTGWHQWSIENPKTTLVDLVTIKSAEKPVRITLLSTAGFGKSEEMQQLAARFSSAEEPLYPVKYSLGNYEGQDIETILHQWNENWKNLPERNILLVLDALDEIGKPADQSFYKKMNAFLEIYPGVQVVVSSRYNFYELTHPPLKGFNIQLLDPLNRIDIDQYLHRQLSNEKDAFQELVYNKGFSEYQDNPYYLTRLVRFFKDKAASFPSNKTELFERILFEQLSKDQTTYQLPGLRSKLYEVSSRLAFCMTLAGKSVLTEDELSSVITDKGTRNFLHNFAILNRNTSKLGSWSFEHKNMQEYLCANALMNASFPQVHKIISLEREPNRLLPKFLNTISFLFELLEKDNPLFLHLFQWLSANEPELLVRFEKEQIEKSTRREIFFRVFASYKEKGLSLRTSANFSFQELAAFVGVDAPIVDFLASEITPKLLPSLLYDAVNIISLCERAYIIKNKINNILFGVIENPSYSLELKASCIRSFYYLHFTDRATFDKVFDFASQQTHKDIRSATLSFLEHTDFQEDFSEFIIENFQDEAKASDERQPREAIKRMVLKFTSAAKIKDLLRFCVAYPKIISQHHSYRSLQFNLQETKDVVEKAIAIYPTDPSILPLMYKLYCNLEFITMYDEWNKVFIEFFEKTCGKERIFRKFYKYGRRRHDMLSFAEEKSCDFIIDEFKNGNVSVNEAIIIRNVLSHINYPLCTYFYEKLKQLPEAAQFTADEDNTDYNALRTAQAIKNQEMLLDKTLFLQEAIEVFKAIAKDKITIRDLWFADTKALRRLQDSLALESVRDVCRGDDDKEISEAEYFEKINDDQFWTGFVMESIKELIEKDRTMVSIKPALIQAMTEWTINEISSIDFEKTTIIEHEGGGYSYFPHTEFVKQAVELLKPALPDDLLLKLLKTDYSSFYSLDAPEDESQKRQPLAALIIEQVKDKSRLKQQIIANIKDSRTPFRVRSTHFKICQVLSYNECLPELYAAVTEQKMVDGFDRVKLSEIYVALGGKWTDFSHLLAVPECPSYEKSFVDFHWHLLEKLLHHETEKVGAILIEILQKDPVESNQLKAAEFLIKLSRIEGLRYWLQHVKTKKGMPFESRWETFYDYIRKMPLAETVDILMEALDSIYQVPLTNPDAHFWRLDDTIFNGLVNLAIQGQFQFEHIQQKVDSLLNKTTGENQRYTIKFFKEKIRNSYYQSINQEMSIRQANEIYEKNLAIVLA